MSQFTEAYVKSETYYNDGNKVTVHFVMLKQEGMFLTCVAEQALREEVPMFNSYDNEANIAKAISEFVDRSVGKETTGENSILQLT